MKKLFFYSCLLLLSISASAQIPSYVPTSGLVGYWPFNGNANDLSVNGNNGTIINATLTTDRNGNNNSAYNFNGNAQINAINPLYGINTEFSGSVWINMNDSCKTRDVKIVGSWNNGGCQFILYKAQSNMSLSIGAQAISFPLNNSHFNNWINVSFTYSSINNWIKLYCNGVNVTNQKNNPAHVPVSCINTLQIGYQLYNSSHFWGKIDEIGLWNRVLTDKEVNTYYTNYSKTIPSNIPSNGLIAYYPFNGNADDESGSAFHGKVVGAALTQSAKNENDKAYYFNNTPNFSSKITMSGLETATTNTFTFSAWFKPDTSIINGIAQQGTNLGVLKNQCVLHPIHGGSYGSANDVGFGLYVGTNGVFLLEHTEYYQNIPLSDTINLIGWHNITIVYNNKLPNLYIDGKYIKSGIAGLKTVHPSLGADISGWNTTSGIGFGYESPLNSFKGKIDEVGFWNRALTSTEIANLYSSQVKPTIASITPTAGIVGTTVTIKGQYFNTTSQNNLVHFGIVKASVVSSNDSTIVLTVPNGAITDNITILNTANGLQTTSKDEFKITFNNGAISSTSFGVKQDYNTPPTTCGVSIADIDVDGKADLIVSNFNPPCGISVFRNIISTNNINSTSFQPKVNFDAGSCYPWTVRTFDLDGDGKKEMILSEGNFNKLSIYKNISTSGTISSSSFAPRIDLTLNYGPNLNFQNTSFGDIDGDGKPDIVCSNLGANEISIFQNLSTLGTITSSSFAPRIDITTGVNPSNVMIADIDGDGKKDIIAINYGNTMSVIRNIHNNIGLISATSFASKIDFITLNGPNGMDIGDIDGDGKQDIIITSSDGKISVFKNNSTPGSFNASSLASRVDFLVGVGPRELKLADLNGDGKLDVVVTNFYGTGNMTIYENNSNTGVINASTFTNRTDYVTNTNPFGIDIADLNGDGKPEIVVANWGSNNVSVFKNIGQTNGVSISTNKDTLSVSKQLVLNVNPNSLLASTNFSGYQFKIGYNGVKLKFDSVSRSNTSSSAGTLMSNNLNNVVSIAWSSVVNNSANTLPLLKLYFTVIDSGASPITIYDAYFDTAKVNIVSNTKVVGRFVYGDIDVNDKIQAYDGTLALKYSVGMDPIPTLDPLPWEPWRLKIANVDTGTSVTANDASLILKYVVGIINQFPKRGMASTPGYVTVNLENNELVVRSFEDMGGLNITFLDHLSDLGAPTYVHNTNALSAFNKQTNMYKIGVAFSEAPVNGSIILRIPYTGLGNQTLNLELVENTAARNYQLNVVTGINDIKNSNIKIYPNPTNNIINIEGLTKNENNTIQIFDVQGKLVITKTINEKGTIDLSELNKGVFVIKIGEVAQRIAKM